MEESEAPDQSDFVEEFFNKLKEILKDKDEETCYKEMFRILDKPRNGFMSNEELRGIFVSVQREVQMTDAEVEELIDDIDKNKDGKVDFSEFYKFMVKE